jgi:glycosyltransferase involved in cell wall biosynthesis
MLHLICPPPSLKSGSDVIGLQTAESLRQFGVNCSCQYLWAEFWARKLVLGNNRFLRKLYKEIVCPVGIARILPRIKQNDVVWVNDISRYRMVQNHHFEESVIKKGAQYVFHLQDYWFHTSEYAAAASRRIEMASLTVVVSHELKRQVLERHPTANVVFLEEPIDVNRVHPVSVERESDLPVLVWTGNPSNLVNHFSELVEVLGEVYREVPFNLRVISGNVKPRTKFPFPMEWFPYSLSKESDYLSGATAGLAPLEDSVYARCKDVYKVKTYMAAGVVPLATGVGHCPQVIQHGETGFMFNSREAWKNGLITTLRNREMSKVMGLAARNYCVNHFSHQALMPVWIDVLRKKISAEI